MIIRKNKIKLIQFFLLFVAISLILFTYSKLRITSSEKILSKETKAVIDEKLKNRDESGDTFFNVKYSGIDLNGNRYTLNAEEANNDKFDNELVNLKYVKAVFYFKNDKTLYVSSNYGLYNNKTLDIIFNEKVVGEYEGSELFAGKAEYYNSKNFLIISENVRMKDIRGTILAEKLIFDIKKNKLNISSSDDKKINANINYKWKKLLGF